MRNRILILLISGVLLIMIVSVAYAAANGYSIDWWTVDGGGGTSECDNYAVSGTIGQPESSPLMTGGGYEVVGGFWGGGLVMSESSNYLFLPMITN